MHELVVFNGDILNFSKANIPAVSAAALYGRGIFTTIAIYNQKPFLWDLHQRRLQDHAAKIKLNIDVVDFNFIQKTLLELVAANKITTGRVRVTLFDAGASRLWHFETTSKTNILITTAKSSEKVLESLRLTVSPFLVNSTAPLAGVKSCNYSENLLILEAAKTSGFDEAMRLNERGEIVSATTANLFWVKNQVIFTPALATGALAGTTRQFVIEQARKLGFTVLEITALPEDLQESDEIYLTSAGIGIRAAKSLDDKNFDAVVALQLAQSLFEAANA